MAAFEKLIRSRWAYAALAALVLACALPGAIFMPPLDRDESRFSQASAQMVETGDIVVIRYHDGLRNKKPVGIHWMQAASTVLTSSAEARDIFSYRLPSLICAALAAMAMFWSGLALFSRRVAFLSAALLGSCLLLTTEAHIAKTDAAQCAFMVLAMGCLAHLRTRPDPRLGIAFWVFLAVGVLLKGVIAPMVAGLTLASLFLWERRAEWMRPLLDWRGPSLFIIMTVPWFLAVQIATNGAFLWEAAAVDLGQKIVSAAEGHKGLPGTHLLSLPLLFWPGSLFLVPGAIIAWRTLSDRPLATARSSAPALHGGVDSAYPILASYAGVWRFLICWIAPTWLVFEIAPTKLVHYTLPAYPALAFMAGAGLERWLNEAEGPRERLTSLALFALPAALLAAAASPLVLELVRADAAEAFGTGLSERVAHVWSEDYAASGAGLWVTLVIIALSSWTILAFIRRRPAHLLAGLAACALATGIGYRAIILPNQTWTLATEASLAALGEVCGLPEASAVRKASGCTGAGPKLLRAIAYAEPSLVFEVGGLIILPPDSTPEIPPSADDPRPAWLINAGEAEGREALVKLTRAASAAGRCLRLSRRFAFNYSNGDPSILVAAVLEPGGCSPEVNGRT